MAFRDFAQSGDVGNRAQQLADAMMFGPSGATDPTLPFSLRFGIHGVGIVRRVEQDFIVLLLPQAPNAPERRLIETDLLDPGSDPGVADALKHMFGGEFDDVKILRIPRFIRNAAAGTAVYGARRGTAGAEARWASGRRGFLTAGHVAIGTTHVDDSAGVRLGRTICAFDPGTVSSGSRPNVDVALIEVVPGAGTTLFTQGGPLSGSAAVSLHLGKGTTSSTVLAMIAWYLWPGVGGTYVDLYMTNAACTVPGDSGAIVTNSAGEAIGTVVGGTTTFTSYIQEIGRQIGTLQTVAGLGTLSL